MIAEKIIILNQTALDSLKKNEERQIIKKFCEVAIKILGADFGFVWVKKRGSKDLKLAYKSPNTPYQPTVPRKTGTTYRVLHRKTPLLIAHVSREKLVRPDRRQYLKSLAIIPITYKNHTYGNMYICFKSVRKFSQEDQALSASIGNSAAQAITINRLHHNLRDIKHTLDHTPEPLLIFEPVSRRISYVNQSLLKQSGEKKSHLAGALIQNIIHPSFRRVFEKRLKHILAKKVPSSIFEVILTSTSKQKLPAEMSLQYVHSPGQAPHLLAIFRDLRERKKSEQLIRHAAFHDALTGLPNRFMFTTRLNDLIHDSKTKNKRFAVIFLDLDRFKLINDTLGHLIGDSLLKEVAHRLKRNVKRRDVVSRLAGDEFVILLTNLHTLKQADQVAKRIAKAFDSPFKLSAEQEIYVTFSMGISVFPKDGIDAEMLLKKADDALYRAKQHGGNSYQHYDINAAMPQPQRLEIEKELRRAIDNKELSLQYQPIVDLKTGKIRGVEALVRWGHPTMGIISPEVFIPYAEESGLIIPLGKWVFAEGLRQLKAWHKAKIKLSMGINVSARELLEKNAIQKMQRLLQASNLSPKDITLEMTETFLIKNIRSFTSILEQLKKLGFRTSLDDFGTGYASLNYLKSLPVDYIKIDKLFIENCTANQQDAGIIKAIIAVAHHLKIKVIAEGVEKSNQAAFLKSHNCDMAQGNYYSPAQSPAKILELSKRTYY
jgi:diguanylate cyclase (GGDEF)-like protein/PAS domain S-box-containing protein